MKKALSFVLVFMLVFSAVVPSFAVTGFGAFSIEIDDGDHINAQLSAESMLLDNEFENYSALKSYLTQKLKSSETEIDVSSFNISASDITPLRACIYYDIVDAFHVKSFSYYRNVNTGKVTRLVMKYYLTKEEYEAQLEICDNTAESLIADIKNNSALSQAEKALLVHDRLIQWCEYDYQNYLNGTIADCSYDISGVFVKGCAVCAGYSHAYKYMLEKMGMTCYLCDSEALNHEWNIVEIDGQRYHVDTTWDDPVWDMYGRVSHNNFLRSTNGIISTGHNTADFNTSPVSTVYDAYYWQNSNAEFQYKNGAFYYFDTSAKQLKKIKDGVTSTLLTVNNKWMASSSSYYSGNYVRLDSDNYGDYLFYSTPESIYKYSIDTGTSTVVYTPSKPGSYYWIYGFKAQDNYFYLNLFNSPNFNANTYKNNVKYKYQDDIAVSHTVTYDYSENGGSRASLRSVLVEENAAVNLTPSAYKSGWSFLGWNTDANAHAPLASLTMGKNDITLYAIYSKSFTVKFVDYSDTKKTESEVQKTVYNKSTSAQMIPPVQNTYTGWSCAGWTDSQAADASPAEQPFTIAGNKTYYGLYSKSVSVTYDLGDTSSVSEAYTALFNAAGNYKYPKFTTRNAETQKGYTFDGWYSPGGTKYYPGFSYTISSSLNLSFNWNPNKYTVSFYSEENLLLTSKSLDFGESFGTLPVPESRTGYVFDGWFTSLEGGTQITEDTVMDNDGDIDVFAHWSHDGFTVKSDARYFVDTDEKVIYGADILSATESSLASCFENANVSVDFNGCGRIATGTKITLIDDRGQAYDTISVVVFGDLNGDGWYDGTDSVIVNCIVHGMLSKASLSNAAYKAADCDHDGIITQADVELLEKAGTMLAGVDQSKTDGELQNDSVYNEYINLIAQSPAQPAAEEEINVPPAEKPGIFKTFFSFIVKIFNMFISIF